LLEIQELSKVSINIYKQLIKPEINSLSLKQKIVLSGSLTALDPSNLLDLNLIENIVDDIKKIVTLNDSLNDDNFYLNISCLSTYLISKEIKNEKEIMELVKKIYRKLENMNNTNPFKYIYEIGAIAGTPGLQRN
jgi:di/tripeptidase